MKCQPFQDTGPVEKRSRIIIERLKVLAAFITLKEISERARETAKQRVIEINLPEE